MNTLEIFHVVWGIFACVSIPFMVWCIWISARHELKINRDKNRSNNIRKNR